MTGSFKKIRYHIHCDTLISTYLALYRGYQQQQQQHQHISRRSFEAINRWTETNGTDGDLTSQVAA